MTVTTESGGRQNAFPNETRPTLMRVRHTKDILRMQKRLMVVGL